MSLSDQVETQHFDNAQAGYASAYVLLDVSDRGIYLPSDFGPSSNISNENILIYAENITITDDIQWPGKNVSIACSNLTLQKSSITIDVSGSLGGGVAAVAEGNGTQGNPGEDAGCIWLYVEQLTPSIAKGLHLFANGGNGGEGGATTDAGGTGGVGGPGGNGGKSLPWHAIPQYLNVTIMLTIFNV